MKKRLFLKICAAVAAVVAATVLMSLYITLHTKEKILTPDEAVLFEADAIMVLGARVRDTSPSLMLADRLERGIEIHLENGAPLIMSGDCSGKDYNEVEVMKNYAVEKGVKEENILTDPQGYSTFESVTRLKSEFNVQKVIIVSQKYHLPRALYIAEKAGLEAVGVAAEDIVYYGHAKRLVREVIAQTKDFLMCMFI